MPEYIPAFAVRKIYLYCGKYSTSFGNVFLSLISASAGL